MTSRNKWFVLAITTLVATQVGATWAVLPVLFSSIIKEFDLGLAQIGVMWSMLPAGFVLCVLPGGALGDRFGFYKIIGIGCALVALSTTLVGLSPNFVMTVISALLCGMSLAVVFPNPFKVAGLFFSKGNLALPTES